MHWGRTAVRFIWIGLSAHASAQTTDGLISGRVTDRFSGAPLARASIQFSNSELNVHGIAAPDPSGDFALPLLSPGRYTVRIEAPRYQALEIHSLDVEVSGRLEIDFQMRPLSDIWEAGQFRSLVMPGSIAVVTFFGPDVDESRSATIELHAANRGAVESSISDVISPEELDALPLEARDAYATLVLQPGVASGTSTGRGLGIAIHGQRPTASNYLLDGVENNNALTTGPLNIVAPEAIQEYRISTSDYSAEFGRTSGFIANAVTRSGGAAWHGLLYFYFQNEALNANDLERNRVGLPRALDRQLQPGFWAGGPILKNRLFLGLSGEYLDSQSKAAPAQFRLPTPQFYSLFHITPPTTSRAIQTMNLYPAPLAPLDPNTGTELATIARPTEIHRVLILPRVDYSVAGGKHRIAVRESYAKFDLPDFIWTPYPAFITPLDQKASGLVGSATSTLHPDLTNEARVAVAFDRTAFERRTNELPSLVTFDPASTRTWLPGSPSFYGFHEKDHEQEMIDNVVRVHGAHVSKFGGGLLLRQLSETLDPGDFIVFRSYASFYLDQTQYFFAPASRLNPPSLDTTFGRRYRYSQFFFFAQDSFRISKRLTIDYGLRYEHFGAPVNNGANPDIELRLGAGSSLQARLASATLAPTAPNQALYDTDNRDFAPRVGFAYRVASSTVLRGSYGLFYDRPFDNLWLSLEANSFVLGAYNAVSTNYLAPLSSYLPALLASPNQRLNVPNVALYQPHLRNGRAQNFFLGLQQQVRGSLTLEIDGIGSLGRDLITTDIINRTPTPGAFSNGTINPSLPPVDYRSNQGSSDYLGVSAVVRYRSTRLNAHLAYTLSHSIDNQTDPLAGDFYDFVFTGGRNDAGQPLAGTLIDNLLQGGVPSPVAAFTRQFDSRGDRANSDFDQRHNLVGYATYRVPATTRLAALSRDWQISAVGAVRSGFPYSVFAPTVSGGLIYNNHANLAGDPHAGGDVPGGVQLLNPAAFAIPAAGQSGNTARNEFRGPGLASADVSIHRSIAVRYLGEAGRVVLRADVFNVLNHANLNNPAANFTTANISQRTFGVATFGRQDAVTGFPSSTPLDESPRVVQLMLRVVF